MSTLHNDHHNATPVPSTGPNDAADPTGAAAELLPGLRGYADNGQDPRLLELDERAGLDLDCDGIRAAAKWRRDSAPGRQLAWKFLDERLDGIQKHRGREWSERDLATFEHVKAQTFAASDVGQRGVHVPVWMSADAFDCPRTGERIELPTLLNRVHMLAVVWDAFAKGAGGVLMSRAQWAVKLKCKPRTVSRIWRDLEARGLIRTWQMLKPACDENGRRIAGSCDHYQLVRIGPTLDPLAPLAFERGAMPRRAGITRAAARTTGGAVRRRARAAERREEGRHYQDQCRYRGRDPAAPWSSSTPRIGRTRRPTRRRGASPARPVPRSSRPPGGAAAPGATAPQDAAPLPPGVTRGQTTPPLSGRGSRGSAGAAGGSPVPVENELASARSVSRAVAPGAAAPPGGRLDRGTGRAGDAPRRPPGAVPDASAVERPPGGERGRKLAASAAFLQRLAAETRSVRPRGMAPLLRRTCDTSNHAAPCVRCGGPCDVGGWCDACGTLERPGGRA